MNIIEIPNAPLIYLQFLENTQRKYY